MMSAKELEQAAAGSVFFFFFFFFFFSPKVNENKKIFGSNFNFVLFHC